MKRFVRLLTERYTKEGIELRKVDEDAARENHTVWMEEFFDPDHIVRIAPDVEIPGKTILDLGGEDYYYIKGSPKRVVEYINEQLREDKELTKPFYVVEPLPTP